MSLGLLGSRSRCGLAALLTPHPLGRPARHPCLSLLAVLPRWSKRVLLNVSSGFHVQPSVHPPSAAYIGIYMVPRVSSRKSYLHQAYARPTSTVQPKHVAQRSPDSKVFTQRMCHRVQVHEDGFNGLPIPECFSFMRRGKRRCQIRSDKTLQCDFFA